MLQAATRHAAMVRMSCWGGEGGGHTAIHIQKACHARKAVEGAVEYKIHLWYTASSVRAAAASSEGCHRVGHSALLACESALQQARCT